MVSATEEKQLVDEPVESSVAAQEAVLFCSVCPYFHFLFPFKDDSKALPAEQFLKVEMDEGRTSTRSFFWRSRVTPVLLSSISH